MLTFLAVLTLVCAVQALREPFLDKNAQRISSSVFTRYLEAPNNIRDVRCLLSQGDTLVPVIGLQKSRSLFVSKRRGLFASGVYPGVEYKLINITVPNTYTSSPTTSAERKEVFTLQGLLGREARNGVSTSTAGSSSSSTATPPPAGQFFDRVLFSAVGNNNHYNNNNNNNNNNHNHNNNFITISEKEEEEESLVELTVAPAYPLISVLERDWPVRIALSGTQPTLLYPTVTLSYPTPSYPVLPLSLSCYLTFCSHLFLVAHLSLLLLCYLTSSAIPHRYLTYSDYFAYCGALLVLCGWQRSLTSSPRECTTQ